MTSESSSASPVVQAGEDVKLDIAKLASGGWGVVHAPGREPLRSPVSGLRYMAALTKEGAIRTALEALVVYLQRAEIPCTALVIEKRGFSRAPWRLIERDTDSEISMPETVTDTRIWMPVRGETKRECVAAMLRVLEHYL